MTLASTARLTRRQHDLLTYVVDYTDQHGYPPTVREIGDGIGLASTSSVHHQLTVLNRVGLIRVDATSSRAIDVRPARDAGYGSAHREAS